MDEQQWYEELNDRTLRYGESPLDPLRVIAITVSPAYLQTLDGQIAVLTAANLLGRLTPSVMLSFEDVPLRPELPWQGRSLHAVALEGMTAANPYGRYAARPITESDYQFHLGPDGSAYVVHGAGWNSYVGPGPSPLVSSCDPNGMGAAFAVVLAAAHVFRTRLQPFSERVIANVWDWRETIIHEVPPPLIGGHLGRIFTIGVGSVGSAALYFLTLLTRNFEASLIDMDRVKVRNITRSPVFVDAHNGSYKVDALAGYLRNAGVGLVHAEPVALHESALWLKRPSGTPDLVIAAANEFDVRYHIEMGYPPVQLYATTGRNWQVTLLRHAPGAEACSLCLFPSGDHQPAMACATDVSAPSNLDEPRIDAALPFLSFAAGLMTAVEILKLPAVGYPFSSDRVSLYLKSGLSLLQTSITHRANCSCESRSAAVRSTMLRGSLYA